MEGRENPHIDKYKITDELLSLVSDLVNFQHFNFCCLGCTVMDSLHCSGNSSLLQTVNKFLDLGT
jgi:hypothetical protein